MAGYNNPRYCDIENEVLRSRLADCKAGAQALADAVHRYLRQECLRINVWIGSTPITLTIAG